MTNKRMQYNNENVQSSTYFDLRTEVGLVLSIVGVQFAAIIREFIPSINLTNFMMALSVVLVVNIDNLTKLRFPSISHLLGLVILIQIYMLFATFLCNVQRYIFNQFYIIIFILALSTQPLLKSFRYFDKIVFWITLLIAVVVVYQGTFGFTKMALQSEAFYRGGYATLENGGDKITLGRALGLGIISSLYYEGKFAYFFRLLLIIFSFVGLLLFNTRAVCFMGIVFILMKFFYFDNRDFSKNNPYRKYVAIVSLVMFLTFFIGNYFSQLTDSFFSAVETLFYGRSSLGADASAINRFFTIKNTMKSFGDSSLLGIVLGQGYFFYVDVPVLQAFHDLGIMGGGLYFLLLIIVPLLFIAKWRNENKCTHILQLFALQYVVDQFYCAEPYQFYHFMPLILLCFYEKNQLKPILKL